MKRKTRWGLRSAVLLACLALILSGCGSSGSGKGKQVTLSMMYTAGSPEEQKGEREIYDEFTKLHPNIKVDLILSPYEQEMDKLLTMASGGNVPDLMWIPESGGPPLLEKGVIRDLNPMLDKSGISRDDWLPGALAYGTYKGKLYGMPRDIVTFTMAYNKDIFDKAGVPYPKAGWTWNDFESIAKTLTIKSGGQITQYGSNPIGYDQAMVENGGATFNRDGTELLLDKPESIEAIQWAADLANVKKVTPTAEAMKAGGDMFLSGKAGMTFTGPWQWNSFKAQGLKWDIVEIPGGKAGNKVTLLGQPIAMSATTKHPDEAWMLLEFLTHGGGQDIQTAKVGAHPSVKGKEDAYSKQAAAPASISVLEDSMKNNTVVTPDFPQYPEAMAFITPVIEQILMGKVQAKDAIPPLAKQLREKFGMK